MVEHLLREGNDLFSDERYEAAFAKYDAAVKGGEGGGPVLEAQSFVKRAAAQAKMSHWAKAFADATKSRHSVLRNA